MTDQKTDQPENGTNPEEPRPAPPDSIMARVEAIGIQLLAKNGNAFTRGQEALLSKWMAKHGMKLAEEMLAEQEPEIDPTKTIGLRTLADLPTGEIPEQLLDPFLSPEGPTVIYGPGDVGKGMLSVHFAIRLVRERGANVMIIDFEHNEHEWGRRARAMGATDEELAHIHYRAPFADDWTTTRGALIHVAHYLRADADRLEVDYVLLDSYSMATTTGDAMGGQAAAQEFYAGIATVRRPALVLAHVAGGGPRFPVKPFGSVFVHNLARETWAVENIETEDIPFDPKTNDYQPAVLALELRNRKMNNGARPENQFISFSFGLNGDIDVTYTKPKKGSMADWAVDILRRAKKALTTSAIAKAIAEDHDDNVDTASLSKALRRDKRVTRPDGEPLLWTLRDQQDDD